VRGGKLIRMYKRPGHRVIINADGDLIVRPMFVEVGPDSQRPCCPASRQRGYAVASTCTSSVSSCCLHRQDLGRGAQASVM